jgi:hypothetical protein
VDSLYAIIAKAQQKRVRVKYTLKCDKWSSENLFVSKIKNINWVKKGFIVEKSSK